MCIDSPQLNCESTKSATTFVTHVTGAGKILYGGEMNAVLCS